MPTYEYACSACGHQFEKFHSITARPVSLCPKCGQRKVKRLISAGAGFIFKGSGFYSTDYRSDAYKADAKSDSAPVKTDAAKTDAPAKTNGQPGSSAKPASVKTDTAPAKTEAKTPAPAASKSDSQPAANSRK
jgi:putative FmdB family regulatory protein